jgi:hypothetical protein
MMEMDDDEKMCRYCFEGEEAGPLISPCACRGGQKWVHLACLRRWQRIVLVSQPTHPAFYERDPRHYKCNVCKGTFTCEPPSRLELMSSFTGPELGALIEAGCVIASHQEFMAELTRQMEHMPDILRERSPYAHWCRGVFLITEVAPLDPTLTAPISSAFELDMLKERLGTSLTISHQGQALRLAPGGALAGVADDALADALSALSYEGGMSLVLARHPPPGCGDDHVRPTPSPWDPTARELSCRSRNAILRALASAPTHCNVHTPTATCTHPPHTRMLPTATQPCISQVTAINLSRPIVAVDADEVARARQVAVGKYSGARDVRVVHYIGGPCSPDEISTCVVTGGSGCGWTVVKQLSEAIELAHKRAYRRSTEQGEVHGGQSVRLTGLQARPDLNGEVGVALRYEESAGRWMVRLKGGEGKQLKPANLTPIGHAHGVVHCVWGDAQWSRTQLLGEIARGHVRMRRTRAWVLRALFGCPRRVLCTHRRAPRRHVASCVAAPCSSRAHPERTLPWCACRWWRSGACARRQWPSWWPSLRRDGTRSTADSCLRPTLT